MVRRNFFPGSEWLYLKVYTGFKTADIILMEIVKPLVAKLKENSEIDMWFYIRYHDPAYHIRFRFQKKNNTDVVFEQFMSAVQPYLDTGEVYQIVVDTYRREIERYGTDTMLLAEELFAESSESILNILQYGDEEKIIFNMFYIDCLLSTLKMSFKQRRDWIGSYDSSFKAEFNANKSLNSQLRKKYSSFIPKYLNFIHSLDNCEIKESINLHMTKNAHIVNEIKKLIEQQSITVPTKDFWQSIIHMHINRTYTSQNRLFEMIIYDYLNRYFTALQYSNT